jgi:hypothetical protein
MSTRLHRQSLTHLIADISHISVRPDRAENDLPHRLRCARKEHPLHQAPNLLAREVLRIPFVGLANRLNLWQRNIPRP